MTKATGMGPLPRILEERISWRALQNVFTAEDVPLDIIDHLETRIPVATMMAIFERAALAAGDRTFGFSVGAEMSHAHFGLWIEYSASADTLGDALRRTVGTARFQQTGGYLALETQGPLAIWRYYPPMVHRNPIQFSDHIIGPMIRFIQSFLEPGWQPAWIELNYPRDNAANLLESRVNCPLHFGRSSVAIALDASHLQAPNRASASRRSARQLTLLDVEANEAAGVYDQPVQSVFSIVVLRLIDGLSDIEGAARMAGLSVQGLQRLLRQEGLTYRKILDHARLTRARALLYETGQSVTEISLALGYSDHANFTRAFNRWEGCSPSVYRMKTATNRSMNPADSCSQA
jgi:AraC-like DNA-binding protein